MRIKYLAVLALIGCSNAPEIKPVASKPEPAYVRHLATKNDLLYTYKIPGETVNGFELAEADAEKLCRSKWNLGVIQKTQPTCAVYNTSSMQCAVTFACQ